MITLYCLKILPPPRLDDGGDSSGNQKYIPYFMLAPSTLVNVLVISCVIL